MKPRPVMIRRILAMLLGCLLASPVANAEWEADVHGGKTSGTFPNHKSRTFTANPPSEDMVFLRWWAVGTTFSRFDTMGNRPRETEPNITLGRTSKGEIEFAAVFGKIGNSFDEDSAPTALAYGFLPAKNPDHPDKRYPMEITVELDRSGAEKVNDAQVFKYLEVTASWYPDPASQEWASTKIVSFWTAESGGEELVKDKIVKARLFRQEGSKFVAKLYYRSEWSEDDLKSPANPQGKNSPPVLGFRSELKVKTFDKDQVVYRKSVQTAKGFLLPVEVVELSPKVKDEEGNDIDGSEKPNQGKPLTPFVEEDPHTNRIAHRDMKVRVGKALKGRKVTWTLEPLFVPNYDPSGPNLPPVFRGDWTHSPTHKDRFEASTAYGTSGFARTSQEGAETTVSDDGFTAIRVNIPPIGFNQGRIKIQIEGINGPLNLIDMEVPAVVVIDPGHGGTVNEPASTWNNATSPTEVREKNMTLRYGLEFRDSLLDYADLNDLNLQVFVTREIDINLPGSVRANAARDRGSDIFISIHFNASNKVARGSEALIRGVHNVNETEDAALGRRILNGVLDGIVDYDNNATDRGVKNYMWSRRLEKNVPSTWAVLSDDSYANTATYHPIRGTLIEVEFIDVPAIDILLNTGPNAASVQTAIIQGMRDQVLEDLMHQPSP